VLASRGKRLDVLRFDSDLDLIGARAVRVDVDALRFVAALLRT